MFFVDARVQYLRMHYLVGLGNPDDEHKKNRHNVGFMALDFIIKTLNLPTPANSSVYFGKYIKTQIDNEEISILYPDTYMNHSGKSVRSLVPSDDISSLIVLYDDIALPIGEIRISYDRGDGGHNGIKSIISSLNSREFIRVRIGVAQTAFWTGKIKQLTGEALPKFVLSNFSVSEQDKLNKEVFPKVLESIRLIMDEGYAKAMNQFN